MNAGVAAEESVKVAVSRVIRADRKRVYEAWTRPEMLAQWFGPRRMEVTDARTDLRVGGAYRLQMQGAGQCAVEAGRPDSIAEAVGVYQEIIPNEKLRFTWRGTWDSGETLVTVEFRDVEGGTGVTLIHERFATPESVGGYQNGWVEALEKLSEFCEL